MMVIKFFGFLMIVGGSFGLGNYYRMRLLERVRLLKILKEVLELFYNEINFCNATLPQCCISVSKHIGMPYGQSFLKIYEMTETKTGNSFYEVFCEQIRLYFDKSALKRTDLDDFLYFVKNKTPAYGENQLQRIEQGLKYLEQDLFDAETELRKKGQLVISVSFLCGLFIVIILI